MIQSSVKIDYQKHHIRDIKARVEKKLTCGEIYRGVDIMATIIVCQYLDQKNMSILRPPLTFRKIFLKHYVYQIIYKHNATMKPWREQVHKKYIKLISLQGAMYATDFLKLRRLIIKEICAVTKQSTKTRAILSTGRKGLSINNISVPIP